MSKENSREHIILQHLAENNPKLLEKLVKDPFKTLKKLGLSESSLRCPEEVHKNLERGKKLADRIESVVTDPVRDLPKIAQLVKESFGEPYEIKKIPFGIQFRERVKSVDADFTVTGTVEFPFGSTKGMLNVRPDFDE